MVATSSAAEESARSSAARDRACTGLKLVGSYSCCRRTLSAFTCATTESALGLVPQAEAPAKLSLLDLRYTQITDDGCAHLASWLRSDALPALEYLYLDGTPASEAARDAVCEAVFWLI